LSGSLIPVLAQKQAVMVHFSLVFHSPDKPWNCILNYAVFASSQLILLLDVIYYVACMAGKMILNIPSNKHNIPPQSFICRNISIQTIVQSPVITKL